MVIEVSNQFELPDRSIFEDPDYCRILDGASDGFWTFDEGWQIKYVSAKMREMLQIESSVEGQNLWNRFPLLVGTGFHSAAVAAIESGTSQVVEGHCPYTNLWLRLTVYPCRRGAAFVYREFTERVRAHEAQQRLIAILEATPDIVCISDTSGRPTFLNAAGRSLTGITEIDGEIELHPQWAADLCINHGIPTAISEGVWVGESALLDRQRVEVPVSVVMIAHRNLEGEVDFISCIARDISDRIEAERQLRDHAALLDQAPDAIIACTVDHEITYWNKGAEHIYGWTSQETIGRSLFELVAQSGFDSEVLAAALEREGEWRGEERHRTRDGRQIIVYSHWTAVLDSLGHEKSYLVINTDITEKKRLEDQFLRTQRLESVGTLANGIAHDLNNILSPILLATRLLSARLNDPDSLQLIDTVKRNAERGADLVRQVLTFVRGADGERLVIPLEETILEVERIGRETFPKSIEIRVEVDNDLPPVSGDPTQLFQVLMNLCLNARDAMPEGGVLTIRAGVSGDGDSGGGRSDDIAADKRVRITVSDTGTGIAAEIREKIFEPFFTTKDPGHGSGLGLSTVTGIITSHRGTIDVETELEKGTTFNIHLPVATTLKLESTRTDRPSLLQGRGENVLVIDDEPDILKMTGETLKAYGYNPILAQGGEAGLDTFARESERIDLVLLDMMMPKVDGVAAIKTLRAIRPEVRIIITSGMVDQKKAAEVAVLGVSAFLAKPCLPGRMIQTIATVIEAAPPGGSGRNIESGIRSDDQND